MNITGLRARVVRLALHPCDATDANYDLLVRLLDVAEAAENAARNCDVFSGEDEMRSLIKALDKLKDTP